MNFTEVNQPWITEHCNTSQVNYRGQHRPLGQRRRAVAGCNFAPLFCLGRSFVRVLEREKKKKEKKKKKKKKKGDSPAFAEIWHIVLLCLITRKRRSSWTFSSLLFSVLNADIQLTFVAVVCFVFGSFLLLWIFLLRHVWRVSLTCMYHWYTRLVKCKTVLVLNRQTRTPVAGYATNTTTVTLDSLLKLALM